MTRINTNVGSLIAQKTLARSNSQLHTSLTRLSTGLRINVGKDDPAGLIASEVLRADIVSVEKAISNSERANQVIATADSALGQVSALLNDIRGLVSEAANTGALSDEQIAANQLQINSSLESIDRIARVTSFQGRRLLDGSLDFVTTSPGTIDSGNPTALVGTTLDTFAARTFGTGNAQFVVTHKSGGSAQNGITINFQSSGTAVGTETVTFTAASGLTFSFTSGASTAADLVAALAKDPTGSAGVTFSVALTALAGSGGGTVAGPDNGTTATAVGEVSGATDGNKILVNTVQEGDTFNNVTVRFTSGATAGSEVVSYSATSKILTVQIADGTSTAAQVISAINADGAFASDGVSFFAQAATGSTGLGVLSAATGSGVTSGGISESKLNNVDIDQANFGTQKSIAIEVEIDEQATQAQLTYTGPSLLQDLSLEIGGTSGFEVFNFGVGSDTAAIAAAINQVSDATGVTAEVVSAATSGTELVFKSQRYGTDAFISARVLSGDFTTVDIDGNESENSRVAGTDVVARINGILANGDGLVASIDSATLDLSFNVSDNLASGDSVTFTITGGGAVFQLGPDVVSNQQVRLGIQGVNTATLGGLSGTLFELRSGQAKEIAEDATGAAAVVDEVISKITSLRGRLGALQKTTLETNIITLNDTLENLISAESVIRDADFAKESAALTRSQILVQSGISVLTIANSNPQNVLALLR